MIIILHISKIFVFLYRNFKYKDMSNSNQCIHRAIRNNAIYRGLRFKKCLPLLSEMGVVKWENCWNGENPNQQPSQELTDLEGSETND